MYLVDTDVLSNIVKRKPSEKLIKKLETVPSELQFTSAINIGEIYFGANRSDKRDTILRAFKSFVFPHIVILPFDEESGKIFGKLKATLEKKGTGCSEPYLRIAAIAVQHSFTLITGNTKHFNKIPGLSIENWLND